MSKMPLNLPDRLYIPNVLLEDLSEDISIYCDSEYGWMPEHMEFGFRDGILLANDIRWFGYGEKTEKLPKEITIPNEISRGFVNAFCEYLEEEYNIHIIDIRFIRFVNDEQDETYAVCAINVKRRAERMLGYGEKINFILKEGVTIEEAARMVSISA